jgi:quinol monooxygenase YgiN
VVQLFLKLLAPAAQKREVTQALQMIMLPARLARGCSRVELWQEVEQPEALCYIEEWDVEQDLLLQLRTKRFNQLLELMERASERPFLEFRFFSERRGLDYIASARSERALSDFQNGDSR